MKAIRIVVILSVIGVVSGGLLAWINGFTEPLIKENRRVATEKAVRRVLPGTKDIKRIKLRGMTGYQGRNESGRVTGNAFVVETNGFQGQIKMMIGLDSNYRKVTGLQILENIETPGLGGRIDESKWRRQFIGLSGQKEILMIKNQAPDVAENEIEVITGATISSKAVVGGLNKELSKLVGPQREQRKK